MVNGYIGVLYWYPDQYIHLMCLQNFAFDISLALLSIYDMVDCPGVILVPFECLKDLMGGRDVCFSESKSSIIYTYYKVVPIIMDQRGGELIYD